MKKFQIILLSFILTTLANNSYSQTEIGKWRDYFAYNKIVAIANGKDKVYCGTELAVFEFSK